MDLLLSQTRDDMDLNEYWDNEPNSVMSLAPTDEEVNSLLGVAPESVLSNPTASTSTWASSNSYDAGKSSDTCETTVFELATETPEILREKLRKIENERKEEGKIMEKLKEENEMLKESSRSLPFGLEPEKFLKGDMGESNKYLVKCIIPRIKRFVDQNRESFAVIFALGEVCEPLNYTVVRTCMPYNRGGACRDGHIHTDMKGNKRIHSCMICWEVLWIFTNHRVVACPLLTRDFYKKIGAKMCP